MNVFTKIVSTLALSTAIAAPAAAMVTPQDVASEVRSAYSSGNVSVVINGSEATLFGWVADAGDKQAVAAAALGVDGIDSIRNRVLESN